MTWRSVRPADFNRAWWQSRARLEELRAESTGDERRALDYCLAEYDAGRFWLMLYWAFMADGLRAAAAAGEPVTLAEAEPLFRQMWPRLLGGVTADLMRWTARQVARNVHLGDRLILTNN
ncbi:MAG TPA: hypothetical protein VF546_23320 [Pyrinomonadaceae bacterium]|jgi:hypothetical protein